MEKNKNVIEPEDPIKNESNSTVNTYDPDYYMKEYYSDMVCCNENCFSCRQWLGYGCGAAGQCNYDPF